MKEKDCKNVHFQTIYYEPVSVCFVTEIFNVVHGDALEKKDATEECNIVSNSEVI